MEIYEYNNGKTWYKAEIKENLSPKNSPGVVIEQGSSAFRVGHSGNFILSSESFKLIETIKYYEIY